MHHIFNEGDMNITKRKTWPILSLTGGLIVVMVFLGLNACQGTQGNQGIQGPAGLQGAAGAQGPVGPAGLAGPQGQAGISGGGGQQGLSGAFSSGTGKWLNVSLRLTGPANGTNLVVGESAEVTVTLQDVYGNNLTRSDFSTLSLYMYGPQDVTRTVTAVKLLNASEDRSAQVHHYIDLKTSNSSDLKVAGNVLTYTLQAVTDETPGTYVVALRVVKNGDPADQDFIFNTIQVRTPTHETQTVSPEKCAVCHLGTVSGQFYFHHVDPSSRNPYGSPSYEQVPVVSCKACHNNNGYASYTLSAGTLRVVDAIVNRVHGVHNGDKLKNPLNTDPATGAFRHYTSVVFPRDVKNCTSCHSNDNWKTKPSRLACGACHDNIWFGADPKTMPAGYVIHPGEPQPDDSGCANCHQPDTTSFAPSIAESHRASEKYNQIEITLSAPANGVFYASGEKPIVTLVIKDDKGNPIDHTTVNETNFSAANLFVYGPRLDAKPVLTNAAVNGNAKQRASVTSTIAGPWNFSAGDTFKISVSGGPVQVLTVPNGTRTAVEVASWLQGSLPNVTVTATAANEVKLQNLQYGDNSKFEIYNSPVTAKMGWKPGPLPVQKGGVTLRFTSGTTMEPYVVTAQASTPSNDLRPRVNPVNYTDPNVSRLPGNIIYQLHDVAGLKPGTYMAYAYVVPAAGKVVGFTQTSAFGFVTFQVGTATEDKKVAANCQTCHGDTIWHLNEGPIHPQPFDTDYCLACHDYGLSGTGEGYARTGGNSTSGWAGYGAKPLSARVHGLHFGAYLNKPENVYAGNPSAFTDTIFAQDIRNCTKCHSSDTTGTWKTASKLACTGCHDGLATSAHIKLNTNEAGVESCGVCHNTGRKYSADQAHNIANPFEPIYQREGYVIGG